MSISELKKVLFAFHSDERNSLLKLLQKWAVVEISELTEPNVIETFPELAPTDSDRLNDLVALTSQIDFTINFLKPYEKKKPALAFMTPKEMESADDLLSLAKKYNIQKTIDKANRLNREIAENNNQIAKLRSSANVLKPWLSVKAPIADLSETKNVYQTLFMIYKMPRERIGEVLNEAGNTHIITLIFEGANYSYYHFACHKEDRPTYEEALASIEAEKEALPETSGTFKDVLKKTEKEVTSLKNRGEKLMAEAEALAADAEKLKRLYDHYTIEKEREEVIKTLRSSTSVSYMEGWVPTDDLPRLERAIKENFSFVEMVEFPPSEDDKPPILLKTKERMVKPFQLITELYGVPNPKEVDPTPLLSPFFAVFFGLCLTDAGYGLVLICLLLFVMIRFRNSLGKTKLVGLLLLGAISTVILGALMGGWFGDVLTRLPEGSLSKNILMSFKVMDPLMDTITFMLICIVLGFIQINFGILIRMYKNLKKGDRTQAIFVQGGWILFINSAAVLVSGFMAAEMIPAWATKAATVGFIVACGSIILFSHRESNNIFVRIAWGLYAIYGSTSYMGDLLSYLRLLALGLATGIIATVVNLIAAMMGEIPYVGVVFAVIILIGGHTFNIAVNALGAFVHTTRLQYVEFFSKFYEGGGRTFKPFGVKPKYTVLKESKE
ncbi:MAG: V-type ATP synthase subunit I [Deltaproteobacteria bacterium]|uniref:V-type ATP synthase subunit I n=1 Tax=Candidatus Zymogenus saltonus TaxID=2844893 RepID=A0A9D8PKK8_9DELT|nr:V-type ATP synthase subunit I [Candidatus Zymogenus saltonus]